MATRRQIICINKPNRDSSHEHITHIGGNWGIGGSKEKITVETAISHIEAKAYEYYVSVGGYTTDVIVVNGVYRKFIKTKSDSTGKDNLLALQEC